MCIIETFKMTYQNVVSSSYGVIVVMSWFYVNNYFPCV